MGRSRRGRLRTMGLVAAVFLVGCDKDIDITFVNLTARTLEVRLSTPKEAGKRVGVLRPRTQRKVEIEIDKDDLPAECAWRAGSHEGRFRVWEDSPKKMRIEIRPSSVPVTDRQDPPDERIKIDPGPIDLRKPGADR